VVLSCHGLLFQQRQQGARFYHRWAARRVAAVTAVSEAAARDYAEFLGLALPVTVIENGVPDQVRQPDLGRRVRHELGMPNGAFLFVAIGNLKPEKGYEDLVDAARRLREGAAGVPFVVAIVGDTSDRPYRERLESQVSRLGLESAVRLLGHRSDTPAVYSAADAFVLSSRSEGLPMVLLEAMSAGLPIVATAVGGIPAVLERSAAGLLVEPAHPAALAEGMRRLLSDGRLREELGARAADLARRQYSAAAMAGRYLDLYRWVVARGGEHGGT
jgi:glycosyltransferase involved in cell wall biosynthesis